MSEVDLCLIDSLSVCLRPVLFIISFTVRTVYLAVAHTLSER